ncbi:MAG TPA: cupin domain-containing protein [Chloroflexi bacterium]|jgi:mannose-6-phosphate isomerase-like protein (cupin superfamily)|nr:cupin domain-containing protein [Chloroflexota bacterium]HCG28375.1 cupin domain-containing protein [Chloroflexota bacterium]
MEPAMHYQITRDSLEPRQVGSPGVVARFMNADEHGLETISLMLGEIQPGDGPRLHRHDYEEVFVIAEGRGTFVIGGETVEAGPGEIVLVPAGIPHRFSNAGDSLLRVTSVHGAAKVAIEWLEPA